MYVKLGKIRIHILQYLLQKLASKDNYKLVNLTEYHQAFSIIGSNVKVLII